MKPDQVVIGTDSEYAREQFQEFFAPFVRTGNPVIFMDIPSAEITKYAANALLATRISFINMISRLCAATGADVELVRRGIGSDDRIGPSLLFAGAGYGGSCFPKDVKALARTYRELDLDAGLLRAVESVNEAQKRLLAEAAIARFGMDLSDRTFGVWGLAFKPGTDHMREATSLVVVNGLLERGARVQAHDPEAMQVARGHFGDGVQFTHNNYDAAHDADALIIVTEWQPFRRPDFERLKDRLRQPILFDGRNLCTPAKMADLGFEYWSVGRSSMDAPEGGQQLSPPGPGKAHT